MRSAQHVKNDATMRARTGFDREAFGIETDNGEHGGGGYGIT
jgi:hypothetical protein